MKDRIKGHTVMILAGALMIIGASLIPLLRTSRWDNLLLGGAFVISAVIVLGLFTMAIKRTQAPKA